MADKDFENEEYQFTEEELATPKEQDYEEPAEKPAGGISTSLTSRKFIVPIVIIVAVLAVYWFLERGDKTQVTETPQVQQQQQVAKPVVQKSPVMPQQVTQPSVTTGEVSDIRQQVADQERAVQSLQRDVKQNRRAMIQIGQNIDDVNNNVKELGKQIKGVAGEVRALQIGTKEQTYTVQSLVAGRAWLQSQTGRLISVKVGDRVKGYGYIDAINPAEGTVLTSSGEVIRFGDD